MATLFESEILQHHDAALAHQKAVVFCLPHLSGRMTHEEIHAAIKADCIDDEGCSPLEAELITEMAMSELDRKLTFHRFEEAVGLQSKFDVFA